MLCFPGSKGKGERAEGGSVELRHYSHWGIIEDDECIRIGWMADITGLGVRGKPDHRSPRRAQTANTGARFLCDLL